MKTKWTYIEHLIETKKGRIFIGRAKTAWDAQLLCIAHNEQENTVWEDVGNCGITGHHETIGDFPNIILYALTPRDARFIILAHNPTNRCTHSGKGEE